MPRERSWSPGGPRYSVCSERCSCRWSRRPELGDKGLAAAGETTNTYEDTGNDLKFLVLDRYEDAAGETETVVVHVRGGSGPGRGIGHGRPGVDCPTVTFTASSKGDTTQADTVTTTCDA